MAVAESPFNTLGKEPTSSYEIRYGDGSNIGALITRIELGVYHAIFVTRNAQHGIGRSPLLQSVLKAGYGFTLATLLSAYLLCS